MTGDTPSNLSARDAAAKWCRTGTSRKFEVQDLTTAPSEILSDLISQPHWSLERASLVGRGWLFENAFEEADFFKRIETLRYAGSEALPLLTLRERLTAAHIAGRLSAKNAADAISPIKVLEFLNNPPFPARSDEDDVELPPAALISACGGMEPYSKVLKERDKLQAELTYIEAQTKGQRAKRAEGWAKLLWAWAAVKVEQSGQKPQSEKASIALAATAILNDFQTASDEISEKLPETANLEGWIKQVQAEEKGNWR